MTVIATISKTNDIIYVSLHEKKNKTCIMNPYMLANYFYSLCFLCAIYDQTISKLLLKSLGGKLRTVKRDVSSTENAVCLAETLLYEDSALNLIFVGQSSF